MKFPSGDKVAGTLLPVLKKRVQQFLMNKLGYIALDIGSTSIKYIVFQKAGKDLIVEDFGVHTFSGLGDNQVSDGDIASAIVELLGKDLLKR